MGLGELPDRQHVPARLPRGRRLPPRLRGLLGRVAAVRSRRPPQESRASRATTRRELFPHRLLPLVRALERAWATRAAVAAAIDALDAVDAWERAKAATLVLLPATAAGDDAAAAALRRPGAPEPRPTAALLSALDGALRAARARRGVRAARASNGAPTFGPPVDDAGAVDALEALVDAVRAAREADAGVLVPATLFRDRTGAARALVAAPDGPGAPGAPEAAASDDKAETPLADDEVFRAHARRLALAAAAGSLVPPPGRSYTTVAALLAGAALDAVNPPRLRVRWLLETALDTCDDAVEVARREVVVTIYDGDGQSYGGEDKHDTSALIDTLRAFYDATRAKERDLIEEEAKNLQDLRVGDFVYDVEALRDGQHIEFVGSFVPNTVREVLRGGEDIVRGFAFADELTATGGSYGRDVRYSRRSLASDISLTNAFGRVSNVFTFSGFQPVSLEKCGVDALWLSKQLDGLVEKKGKTRWVLRGNRGFRLFWRRPGETRWRCATRGWTPIGG